MLPGCEVASNDSNRMLLRGNVFLLFTSDTSGYVKQTPQETFEHIIG